MRKLTESEIYYLHLKLQVKWLRRLCVALVVVLLVVILAVLQGCAVVERHPNLARAGMIVAGAVAVGMVAHEANSYDRTPQAAFPPPRAPAPFNPCSGSNLCAK